MSPKTRPANEGVQKRTYSLYLEQTNIKFSTLQWLLFAVIIAFGAGAGLFYVLGSFSIAAVVVMLILILFIGAPIVLKQKRDSAIEEAIPDVFEELATSLRAGATIEQALVDLTKIQKGPLIDELKIALKDMEGGLSFEESIQNLITRVDIQLLKRTLNIVIDGRKAGGELADILDAVSSDARDVSRLQRERVSKTLMYVIFIFAAGAVIAPTIFGFVSQISNLVISLGATTNPLMLELFGVSVSILWLYLVIESLISGIMIAVVRGDKIWRGVLLYSFSMMAVSTIVFEVVRFFAASMLGLK